MTRILFSVLALGALVLVAYAAEVPQWWDLDDAREATQIDFQIGKNGAFESVGYHVDLTKVPPAVDNTWLNLPTHPGLPAAAAEIRWEGGQRYYELSAVHAGKRMAATFTREGTVHRQEIEVESGHPQYPTPAVQQAVTAKYPSGTNVSWEAILDGAGQVVEYHVKLVENNGTPNQKHYRLIVLPSGFLAGAYLEIVAELEVPAPPR